MNSLTPIKKHRKSIAVFLAFLMLFGLLTNIFQAATINAQEETADDAATIVEITTTSGIIKQASGSSYIEALNTLRQTLQQSDNIDKIRVIKGKITSDEWVNILKNPSPYFIIDKEVNAEEMPSLAADPIYNRSLKEFRTYANLPNISTYAFRYCTSLETVVLSGGAGTIGAHAFANCTNLRQIILPDNLKTIGNDVFAYCRNLTEIHLPESLEMIGKAAFYSCSALRTVTIPAGVTTMETGAFSSCSMLEEVTIPEDTKLNTIADNTFYDCPKIKHITIPDNIKTIEQLAFSRCTDLESITLPNGIRFESSAFHNCSKLDTLNIIVKEGRITSANIIAPTDNAAAFTNLPEPRTLAFYTEDGTPLSDTTNPTISDAMKAYAAYNDGNTTDEKWYGWNIVRAFSINNKLTNIISSNPATDHRPSVGDRNVDYTTTLSVDEYTNPLKKFTLPQTISVTIGTSPAIAGVHYTYDSATGELTIPAEYIKGDITIKADATDITDYYVQIQSTGTGTTKLYVNSKETSWDSPVKVKNSDKVVLVFLADEGSVVDSLLVNGASQTITEPAGFSHPLNVNEHCIISVTYSEDTAPTPTTNPTASPSPTPDIPTPTPTVSPSPTPDIPTPTTKPSPVPSSTPTVSPTPGIPSATPSNLTTSPTINPKPVSSSAPTTLPSSAPTQTPGVSISDLMSGLGVSEETAVKIQKVANELDVSKDTLLVTDETITSQKTDDDIKGAYYSRIQAQAAQTSEKDIRLTWNRVKGADGYRIYGNCCNTRKHIYEYKLTKTIQNGNKKSYVKRKCKKGTFYKFIVRAYKVIDGKKVTIAVSKTIHATTIGGKYGNAESVKLKKNKASLMAGQTFRIKAKEIKKNKPLRHHREIKYESNNPKVATVSEKGVVNAKKAGVCTIYAYAQNGRYKKTTIKVKVRK